MKNISALCIGLSLFFFTLTGICDSAKEEQAGAQTGNPPATTLSIVSSAELNSLATAWANEYGQQNSSLKITVSEFSNDQALASNQLAFISNESAKAQEGRGHWKMVIGHDATVAIFNANNPMLKEINSQGISADEIAQLISDPSKRNWSSILKNGQNIPVRCFTSDNKTVREALSRFTTAEKASLEEATLVRTSEVISAVQKDMYAIGFCKLTDVKEAGTNHLVEGIKLLPVDKNKNGRLDSFENIYANTDLFTRGVWIGKYPHALCGNIYAASTARPTDKNTLDFLSWVITEGQKQLHANGYSDLASTEVKASLEALAGVVTPSPSTVEPTTATDGKSYRSAAWLIAVILLIVTAFLAIALVRYGKRQKWTASASNDEATPALNENTVLAPKGIYYDKTHTWAFMEPDGNVKIGIDDFLQHVTGTLTRIIMKEPGERVRKGEKILTIVREGKQLNIYAPVSGIIKEQNTLLLSDSTIINSSPFAEGWVYLIEPTNWVREIRFLFMGERYQEWLEDEFMRLKDFFAASAKLKGTLQPQVILQDGGELTDHLLAEMGPEVWEEFQIKFINTSK